MSDGFHAAEDGSLARSTGGAAARGAMLIALAIVIGLVLLTSALNDPDTEVASVDDDTEEVAEDNDGDADADADGAGGGEEAAVAGESTDDDAGDGAGDDAEADSTEEDAEAEEIPEEPIEGSGEARPPGEVNVIVANGVGTPGIAGATADVLVADGYIGVPADAINRPDSLILYQPGFDADARAVAEILGATPDIIQPVAADGTIPLEQNAIEDGRAAAANVVVIIGGDGIIATG